MISELMDETIIGEGYLPYIRGIVRLLADDKVILLNSDSNIYFDSVEHISSLDVEYFKQLGSRWGITPLCHLDLYIQQQDYKLQIDDTLLYLSDSPYMNLYELFRKFLSFADNYPAELDEYFVDRDSEFIADFNDKFSIMLLRLSADIMITEHWSSLPNNFFLSTVFEDLRPLVKVFYSQNSERLNDLFLLQGSICHKNICDEKTEMEKLLSLVHLLSPRYILDVKRLIGDLQKLYLQLGGQELFSKICDWDFSRKNIVTMQLDCFAGICNSRKVLVMDDDPLFKQQYVLKKNIDYYVKYCATFSYPSGVPIEDWQGAMQYGLWQKSLKESLFWDVIFHSDYFEIKFLLQYIKGTHAEQTRTLLKEFIKRVFVEQFFSLSFVCLNRMSTQFYPYLDSTNEKITVVANMHNREVKNSTLSYAGPYAGQRFGTFSLLKSLSL